MAISQARWAWTAEDWRVLRQAANEAAHIFAAEGRRCMLPSVAEDTAGYQQVACCFYALSSLAAMARVRGVETNPIFVLAEQELTSFISPTSTEHLSLIYRLADLWLKLPEKLLLTDDFAGTILQLMRAKIRVDWKSTRENIDADLFEQILLTQISTPHWLVEFMTNATLGIELERRGWNSGVRIPRILTVAGAMKKSSTAEQAALPTLLDPACGSGRFLLYGLTVFVDSICQTEGCSPAKAVSVGLKHLYGLEIDPIVLTVCRGQLLLKAVGIYGCTDIAELLQYLTSNIVIAAPRSETELLRQAGSLINQQVAEDFGLGARWQSGPHAQTYDIVLMNPPYLDKREYGPELKQFLKTYYPHSRGNLYGAFLQRMVEFCRPGGRWAAITPQSWLYLKSYTKLRRFMIEENSLELMIHFGFGVFAETVDTAAMIGKRTPQANWNLLCVDLFDWEDKNRALETYLETNQGGFYTISKSELTAIPDYEFCYKFSPRIRALFRYHRSLDAIANIALGMKTSDNKRFLRYWWEVRKPHTPSRPQDCWIPYEKETSGYPFYRAPRYVVDWSPEAVSYYQTHYSAQLPNRKYWFAEGITFGMLSSRGFAAKYLPPGHMTDMASNLVIPHNGKDIWFILGFLNSRLAGYLLHNLNPSINFQVRDIARLPLCDIDTATYKYISSLVQLVVYIERRRDSWDETSPEFSCPLLLQVEGVDLRARLSQAWNLIKKTSAIMRTALEMIDTAILTAYKIDAADRQSIAACDQAGILRMFEHWSPDHAEWERRQLHTLVAYAVGCVLKWWTADKNRPNETGGSVTDTHQIKVWLENRIGNSTVLQLEERLNQTLEDYLMGDFLTEHRRHFGGKPVFVVTESGKISLVASSPS